MSGCRIGKVTYKKVVSLPRKVIGEVSEDYRKCFNYCFDENLQGFVILSWRDNEEFRVRYNGGKIDPFLIGEYAKRAIDADVNARIDWDD